MGWMQFTVAMFNAGIWPVTTIVLLLLFRKRISALLGQGLRRLKLGPLEAEWDEVAKETLAAVEVQELEAAAADELPDIADEADYIARLRQIAKDTPEVAVVGAFRLVEMEARELAIAASGERPRRVGFRADLGELADRGLIGHAAAETIDGLRRLRNIAAHGIEPITPAQAFQYLDLADRALKTLRTARELHDQVNPDSFPRLTE